MTDLRHVAQLLHEAGVSEGLGPTAMATWLGRRINEADRDTENEERARRLESDAEAVQVITIHRSKGLEFPVVLCPYMWGSYTPTIKVPVFHDPDNEQRAHHRRRGRGQQPSPSTRRTQLVEERGEDLRLLYVALTRAQHQAVLWWVGASDCQHSPLSRLLFDRDERRRGAVARRQAHADEAVEAAFTALGPRGSVERVGAPARRALGGGRRSARRRSRSRSSTARSTWAGAASSYSGITSALHEQPAIGSEPEEPAHVGRGGARGRRSGRPAGGRPDEERLRTCPWGWPPCPAARWSGRVVHSVLERVEFDAPDLAAEVGAALDARGHVAQRRPRERRRGRRGAVHGHRVPARSAGRRRLRLRDIPRHDRLDELGLRDPAGRRRRPDGDACTWPRWPTSWSSTSPRTIPWPATPTGCGTRRSGASCGAT